jgi:hypothetical protein
MTYESLYLSQYKYLVPYIKICIYLQSNKFIDELRQVLLTVITHLKSNLDLNPYPANVENMVSS